MDDKKDTKVLIHCPYWVRGGIERVIQMLAEEFDRHGNPTRFIILTESPRNPSDSLDLPPNCVLYSRKFAPYNDQAQEALREFVFYHDPDVVIVMGGGRALYKIPRALVDSPYPIILSEHVEDGILQRQFRWDWRFLEAVRNTADINHVLSAGFARRFADSADVRVISNPVYPVDRHVTSATLDTANAIVSTSRYDWGQKQPDVLVRAFAEVAGDFPDWRLVFYGSDWHGGKARLADLASSLGVGARVDLNDSTDDVPGALLSSSIFAFPSAYEGFGLAFMEAIAHGLPSVAFDFPGMPEVVARRGGALIVDGGVRNVDGLARALRSLMGDASLRRELSQAALRCAGDDSLSPEVFYQEWNKAIQDAAGLKGKNKLRALSVMEKAYIEEMTSGRLFDQLHVARSDARLFVKFKEVLKKYRVYKVAERAWVKFFA